MVGPLLCNEHLSQGPETYLRAGAAHAPRCTGMNEKNRLLAALAADDYLRLLPDLEPVHLEADEVLTLPGERMRYVYFPRGAVVCLRVSMEDGRSLAGATIGNEGVVGRPGCVSGGHG